jgi:hypothetical protein
MTNPDPDQTKSVSAPSDARPDSEARDEMESRAGETAEILASGPKAGSRAGALAFLALVAVLAGAAYFYMADGGYLQRLDADLLRHAELAMRSGQAAGGGVAVAPSWPLALYDKIRNDIALYAAVAAGAAYLWHLSARARARRDAFLLHDSLEKELVALRERVAELEGRKGKQDLR